MGPKPGQPGRNLGRTTRGESGVTWARVEEIAQTMRNGTFRSGVTLKQLAAKWGITVGTASIYSAKAAAKVRAEVTDPDRVAAKGFALLEKIADDSVMDAEIEEKASDRATHRSVAIKAVDTWLTKSGVAAPNKSLVAVGSLDHLTDEQLEQQRKAIVARMAAAGEGELPAKPSEDPDPEPGAMGE